MCEPPEPKVIKELIYQRIKIALAVAAIKSKPSNISLEEHAVQFQARYKREFEHEQLQHGPETQVDNSAAVPGFLSTNLSETQASGGISDGSEYENSNQSKVDTSLEFIQAIVQLKSTLNLRSSISSSHLQDLLPSQYCSMLMSQDSGVDSSYSISQGEISCSAVKYLLRSTDIDRQLLCCVATVLVYIEEHARLAGNWKGSMLECAVSLLVDLVDSIAIQNEGQGECQVACVDFAKKMVDKIIQASQEDSFTDLERQCVVIVEMCSSPHLMVDVIAHIVDLISARSRQLQPLLAMAEQDSQCDRDFYLFHLLELILDKYNRLRQYRCSPKDCKKPYCDVLKKWKASWSIPEDAAVEVTHAEQAPLWRSKLEQAAVNSTNIDPLFTLYTWRCRSLLTS